MFLKKKSASSLARYQDPTGEFSNQALQAATWYVRHKVLFSKIALNILVGWCVVSISGSLMYWVYYVAVGMAQDRTLLTSLSQSSNYTVARDRHAAKQLQISGVQVFLSAMNRYTLAADVTNPNPNWVATVTYRFSYGNKTTASMTTILLPQASRPIIAVTESELSGPQNPRFEIQQIDWQRIDPHVVKDPEKYIAARLQFAIEDVAFNATTSTSALDTTQILFTISNNTAYSYWEPVFSVELLRANTRVGILTVTVPELHSAERRVIDVRSVVPVFGLTQIRVTPIIDIFKKDVYIEPGT